MAQTKIKLIADGVIDVNNLAAGHTITTDNIGEGSNLYYTDARVSSYLTTNSYATESFVSTAVANLVDAAPTTLDTLNELAAALGDDPNFATTVTNSIATKLPLAGGNITGNLSVNTNTLYVDTVNNRVYIGSSSAYAADSATITSSGFVGLRRTSATPLELRRDTTDGNLIALQKDGVDIAQLGVATSDLTFNLNGSERVRFYSSGNIQLQTPGAQLRFQNTVGPAPFIANAGANNQDLYISTNGEERVRFDAGGRVGIGVSDPSSYDTNADNLVIGSTGPEDKNGITIVGGDTGGRGAIYFADTAQNSAGYITYFHSDNSMLFGTSDQTRMRIDSNGRLLIGKNASNFASTGVELRSDEVLITRDGGSVLSLNRLSSDGDIIALVKDNSTVGRIGAFTGESYIGTRNTGFHFNDTGDQILPFDPQNVTYRDNGIDLGQSGYRWKNIWLSGAAYIGGTAAANALDDYEEGTWTPLPAWGGSQGTSTYTATGRYTKVGNVVHVYANVGVTTIGNATGNFTITGLPFTAAAGYAGSPVYLLLGGVTATSPIQAYIEAGVTYISFEQTNNGTQSPLTHANVTTGDFVFVRATYTV